MSKLELAYNIGVKLALANANQFQQVAMEQTSSQEDIKEKSEEDYSDSVTRNMREHNKHVAGNNYSDPIELSKNLDSVFMN